MFRNDPSLKYQFQSGHLIKKKKKEFLFKIVRKWYGNKSTRPQVNSYFGHDWSTRPQKSQLVPNLLVNSSPLHKSTRPQFVYIVFSHSKSTRPQQKNILMKNNIRIVILLKMIICCICLGKFYENDEIMYFFRT